MNRSVRIAVAGCYGRLSAFTVVLGVFVTALAVLSVATCATARGKNGGWRIVDSHQHVYYARSVSAKSITIGIRQELRDISKGDADDLAVEQLDFGACFLGARVSTVSFIPDGAKSDVSLAREPFAVRLLDEPHYQRELSAWRVALGSQNPRFGVPSDSLLVLLGVDSTADRSEFVGVPSISHAEQIAASDLAGTWSPNCFYSKAQWRIAIQEGRLMVEGWDSRSDGSFEVSDVSLKGDTLRFTSRWPSTDWTVHHRCIIINRHEMLCYTSGDSLGASKLFKQ